MYYKYLINKKINYTYFVSTLDIGPLRTRVPITPRAERPRREEHITTTSPESSRLSHPKFSILGCD
jgi:hypothetical protein